MDRVARCLALLGAASLVSGCVYWTEPLQTQIVDASTGQPIANARVAAWPAGKENRAQIFVADDAGRVAVPSLKFSTRAPAIPG